MNGPTWSSVGSKVAILLVAGFVPASVNTVAASPFEFGSVDVGIPPHSLDIELKGESDVAGGLPTEVHIIDTTNGVPPPAGFSLRATAIASAVGIGTGALSYGLWVIIHEGTHAAAVELAGGDVTKFTFVPERMEGGGVRFAATYYEDPHGRITQREAGWIDIATNITGLAVGTLGSALWLADALPTSRLARMAFASFQIGASINGGIIGVWSDNPLNDIPKAIQAFEMSEEQARLFRTVLTTGAVLNLIPALDSLIYGITGRRLFSSIERSSDQRLQVRPLAGPGVLGMKGEL